MAGLRLFGWYRAIVENGFKSIPKYMRMKELKSGKLIGEDAYGNKYYEDTSGLFSTIAGRHRWIEYKDKNFDATQVPPEWHSWLHYMTNTAGIKDSVPKFVQRHHENKTGSSLAYKPSNHFLNKNWAPVNEKRKFDFWQGE